MKDQHIKFMDFVLSEMSKEFGRNEMLNTLADYFEDESGIRISFNEVEFLEEKFFGNLFVQLSNVGLFKLSTEAHDLIDKHGTYSNYLNSLSQDFKNEHELKELQKENLQLDNENKKYQIEIRDQKETIRKLTIRLSRFELLKKYWWLLTLIFGIGLAIGKFIINNFFV